MAISTQGPQVWFINSAALDYRAFDLETLADGRVLVAMGGSSVTNAALHTAILNLGTGQLGPIDTSTWTPTSFAGTVRKLDITAGNGGGAMITLHSTFSSAGGADSNFSLVTLTTTGGTQSSNDPLPVNPGTPEENTYEVFSTVHLAGGGYAVFFTEPGTNGIADLSNGIRMARFDEAGRRVGGTQTVIGEVVVNPLMNLQNNPEQPAAVILGNGNIGLYYKENLGNGFPRFLFQELTPTGALVGDAVEVSQGGVRPVITSLDNGTQLATWFDVAAGRHKGRIIDTDGDLSSSAFNISTGEQQPYSVGSVIATQNGFAFSWYDTANGLNLVQMFGMDGKARSNPFLVTDSSPDYAYGSITGIERNGAGLMGYVFGLKAGSLTSQLEGQVFSGDSSIGLIRNGGAGANTINGGALDDRLNLGGGNDRSDAGAGNDVQSGGRGNDTMAGGAGFDRLDGGTGSDRMDGGLGTDILQGRDGNDRLVGGGGSDRLTGGMGRDTMVGGAGADMFIFSGPTDSMTTVTDFDATQGDKLKILVMEYGFLGFFGPVNGTEANPTSSGLYFNTETHILSNDRDGAGTLYQRVNIAYLPGVDSLTINDILTF